MYDERFLSALGAWQRGWHEDKTRRLAITNILISAVDALHDPLPTSYPLPLCYRKRFLVPNNPQNGGDFVKLVMEGRIEEGVAAWSSDITLHQQFKTMRREGAVATLFAHRPSRGEVLVDLNALWADPIFSTAVTDYARRQGANADALTHFRDRQRELILTAPLLREEVVGFAGIVGDEQFFFEAFGAKTSAEEDAIFRGLVQIDALPGDTRWIGAAAAQRAIAATRLKWQAKLSAAGFRDRLLSTTAVAALR